MTACANDALDFAKRSVETFLFRLKTHFALKELEKWLRGINPSAANSLLEAFDEILLLHRLNVPEELRPALRSTNGIENLFSSVCHREKNVKNYSPTYRGKPVKKGMSQRWLGTTLLNTESNFRGIKGASHIPSVIRTIEEMHSVMVDSSKVGAA